MFKSAKKAVALLSSIITLASCAMTFSCRNSYTNDGTAAFSVSVSERQARTALAQGFLFSAAPYTYTLTATDSSGTLAVFEEASYSELGGTFYIAEGTYSFTLKALYNHAEAFAGEINDKTMSGSGNSLRFSMSPCGGIEGQGEVTIEIPDSDVFTVRAGIASSPFAAMD